MLDQATTAFVRDVVAKAKSCERPVREAEILPAEAYVDERFWRFEKAEIFAREWLCIGHVNQVAVPGSYLQTTMLGEPIILARDETGVIHVLSAICQHRGHPIIGGVREVPLHAACLKGRRLVCPYHNWVYGLDGSLVGAPEMEDTTPVEALRRIVRLPQIRFEVFHGLVFINFDDDAAPLAPRLAKFSAECATYGIERLVPGAVLIKEDLRWNWKLHHENALEPYHTAYVHRGHHDAAPSHLTRFTTFDGDDGQIMRMTGFTSDKGDIFEKGGERPAEIAGLTERQRQGILFVSIMPNVVMVLQPSFITMTIIDPDSAGSMQSKRINLYPKAVAEAPDFQKRCDDHMAVMKTIIMQDEVTQIALQKAYHSRYAPRGHLSRLETAITQLNAWLVRRYEAALLRLDPPHDTQERLPRPIPPEAVGSRP